MSQVWTKERVSEWDAATDFDKLPDRVSVTGRQAEATRKSGRKKGLARLTKMAGLGLIWMGCSNAKPPVTAAQAADAASCKLAYSRAIGSSTTCPEAQLKLDSDPSCQPFGHINLGCSEFAK